MDEHGLRKTFKYQLHLMPTQARAMDAVLHRCRKLYNAGLKERREAWRKCQVSVTEAM